METLLICRKQIILLTQVTPTYSGRMVDFEARIAAEEACRDYLLQLLWREVRRWNRHWRSIVADRGGHAEMLPTQLQDLRATQ